MGLRPFFTLGKTKIKGFPNFFDNFSLLIKISFSSRSFKRYFLLILKRLVTFSPVPLSIVTFLIILESSYVIYLETFEELKKKSLWLLYFKIISSEANKGSLPPSKMK